MKSIKEWAPEDRPRERLLANGADTLSKAELLAILIGSGVQGKSAVDIMRTILSDYGDSLMSLAKASVQELMRYEGEPMPKIGDYSVILNSRGDAVCIIMTTRVYVETFERVTEEHAFKEGEGDRSLDYWRRIHKEFFTEELDVLGLPFNEGSELVCEEFMVAYVPAGVENHRS